jgi:hypothetical protein
MRSLAYKAVVLIVVIVPLLATGLAIRLLWARAVHWPDLALLFTMYALVAFGVTVGYHRMLTHRSFRPHPVVKCLLLIISSGGVQNPSSMTPATSPVEKYLTFSIFAVILRVVPNNITPQGARPATTKGV